MLLRESDLNIYQLKLERLVSNADIQWWLYKSILCRQPLSRKPFNDWYGMFRLFSNLVDEFEDVESITIKDISKFSGIKSSIDSCATELKPKLSNDVYTEFEVIINKLKKHIDDIAGLATSELGDSSYAI